MEADQRERLERMGYTQAPTETDYQFHDRVVRSMRQHHEHMRYGTKAWFADRALGAHWLVEMVSIVTCDDNPNIPRGQVHVECWGHWWWPFRIPERVLRKVHAHIARDMPINVRLFVEDGKP